MKIAFLSVAVFSLLGCVAKSPDSLIGEVAKTAPGSWSATDQAKSGVDLN